MPVEEVRGSLVFAILILKKWVSVGMSCPKSPVDDPVEAGRCALVSGCVVPEAPRGHQSTCHAPSQHEAPSRRDHARDLLWHHGNHSEQVTGVSLEASWGESSMRGHPESCRAYLGQAYPGPPIPCRGPSRHEMAVAALYRLACRESRDRCRVGLYPGYHLATHALVLVHGL